MSRRAFWFGALLSVPRRPIVLPRVLANRRAPLIALALVMALSAGARIYEIRQPSCYQPCTPSTVQFEGAQVIGDEAQYVNAARSIAGLPQGVVSPYGFLRVPSGDDPNAAHPQLAKIVIAGGIKLFGDGPWGWRLGSVLFSLIAMGAMYALVTGAGGSPWLAVGAVTVMALDNLMLVLGRIAMLDIYVLAMMLVAGAFYVRRRPMLAGAALGVGACMKEVAFFLLVALVLFEAVRVAQNRWGPTASRAIAERPAVAIRPLLVCVSCTFASFFALLWLLDVLVPAWDPQTHTVYGGNPFAHFAHIVNTGASFVRTREVNAPSSTPLQWLINQKPVQYAHGTFGPVAPGAGLPLRFRQALERTFGGHAAHVTVNFRGEMNPFIIFLALPGLALAIVQAWRTRDRVALIGAAWGVGVFVPFLVLNRALFLYYVLIVLPGIYLMTAKLFSWRYVPRLATVVWAGLLVFGFIHLYPIRSFP